MYLYRAVDKQGNTIDFLLTKRRNKRAAHLFLLKAIQNNGKPLTINIDKSGPGFTYDLNWIGLRGAFPISITMPLRAGRIAPDAFLPWAANLLPESEQLRTLGQLLGMARSDVIGLLSAIGGDTAGLSASPPFPLDPKMPAVDGFRLVLAYLAESIARSRERTSIT